MATTTRLSAEGGDDALGRINQGLALRRSQRSASDQSLNLVDKRIQVLNCGGGLAAVQSGQCRVECFNKRLAPACIEFPGGDEAVHHTLQTGDLRLWGVF